MGGLLSIFPLQIIFLIFLFFFGWVDAVDTTKKTRPGVMDQKRRVVACIRKLTLILLQSAGGYLFLSSSYVSSERISSATFLFFLYLRSKRERLLENVYFFW
ncbi:hypothetical protein DM02DRAFT_289186 [Periconia macrospinosa]|uniref:Uncharacterized protein n=1 Tax=Periconia macrospinosa TaxID=97972 RepID=A0A2V1EDK1_9PLEO|nr:hypothetical protein DM02DRAFT_289186 [Periconia macrospinosa]